MRRWIDVVTRPFASSLMALVLAAPLMAQGAAEDETAPVNESAIDTAPDDMGEEAPLLSAGEPVMEGEPASEIDPAAASDGDLREACEDETVPVNERAIDTAPDDMGEEAPLLSAGEPVMEGEPASEVDPAAASDGDLREACEDETAPVNESAIDTAPDDMGEEAPLLSAGEPVAQPSGEDGSSAASQRNKSPTTDVDPK